MSVPLYALKVWREGGKEGREGGREGREGGREGAVLLWFKCLDNS